MRVLDDSAPRKSDGNIGDLCDILDFRINAHEISNMI